MNTRKSGLGRCLLLASAFLSLTGVAWAEGASITLHGTDSYPYDLDAVQSALDDAGYGAIVLSGTFDFGDGGVRIARSNVTLEGPATIRGGSTAVEVAALDTQVKTLNFEAPLFAAIAISIVEPGTGHVIASGNSMSDCFAGIAVFPVTGTTDNDVRLDIRENTIRDCDFGFYADEQSPFTYATTIQNNRIENINYDGVFVWTVDAPIDIIDNDFANVDFEAIWVGSWDVSGREDPEYGDNPPVNIIRNTIDINDVPVDGVAFGSAGIMVGISNRGINNVLVEANILRGVAGFGGLVKQPYGHNNRFIGNDLSGLKTYGPQIWLMGGRDNLFAHNVLGETKEWAIEWLTGGIVEETAATLSSTANWHLADLNTPDPVNYGNVFIANDYRATGLPGWDEGVGSVLLLDFVQKYTEYWEPYVEPVTTENFVVELGKFPRIDDEKTKVCTQVLDMSNLYPDDMIPGTNRVAGWRRCEGMARRTNHDD